MRIPSIRLLVLAALATGCDATYSYAGLTTWTFFPLDGDRSWTYVATADASKQFIVEKGAVAKQGKTEIVTLEHYSVVAGKEGDLIYQVDWSSDVSSGVQIHGFSDAAGSVTASFDPPVTFLDKTGKPGDVIETETGGTTWTSTFVEECGCGTPFQEDWDDGTDCIHVALDDGDGDPATNGIVTGDYHLITRYGTAWIDVDYYGEEYRLSESEWSEN